MEKCDRGGGRSRSSLALLAIGFYAILAHWDVRKYAIEGEEISYICIKTSIIIMIVPPPPTDKTHDVSGRFRDKTRT